MMAEKEITIYQSMWFKPYLFDIQQTEGHLLNSRLIGGWKLKKHFYMAWALSIYRLKKYYKNIVLVTDTIGKNILIDTLQFPYAEVHTDLELLDSNSSLWALGKLKTYAKANTPFLHIDGDVCVWKKLKSYSKTNELMVQSYEYNHKFYREGLDEIENHFEFIPNELYKIVKSKENIISFNAGVFGSNNTEFIKEYTQRAYEFIDRNTNGLSKINIGRFNTIYEQLLCFYLAKKNNINITPLLKTYKNNENKNLSKLVEMFNIPKTNYIHPLGHTKLNPIVGYQIEQRLKYEFPKIYKTILELDRNNRLL